MLRLFYGTDTISVRQAGYAALDACATAGADTTVIESTAYQQGLLADIAGGISLFGSGAAYLIDTPSERSEFYEDVLNALPLLAASPHTFIVIEGALLADQRKKFAKQQAELTECKAEKKDSFNVFALADALARRDKKTLWMLLQDAYRAGLSGEEVVGTLWWQLKTLRLAAETQTATEAGMKDFPYSKAKRALVKFKDGELRAQSHALLTCYHDARLGALELDLALERWVLSL